MKINTCTNKNFLRKIKVDNHTKSHNFLKISMFSNKMFTFSSSGQLFEKINISHEIQFFFPKLTYLHKNWRWEKHSSLYSKVCTTWFYHCT